MKISAGIGAGLASTVMQMDGYINGAAVQSDSAMNAILMATTVVPAVLFGLAILSTIGYKLDSIYPKVIKELQRRKTQLSS